MKKFLLLIFCCLHALMCHAQTNGADTPLPETDAIYSTGDQVPGDPNNGIEVLRRVFSFIQIFRKNHQGAYTNDKGGVFYDIFANQSTYGFDANLELTNPFSNPDGKYSDDSWIRRDPLHMADVAITDKRVDGENIGEMKLVGTQDVLAFSKTYYHWNIPDIASGRRLFNPVGFYQVLYDDGQVAQIPYDEALFVCEPNPQGEGIRITTVFPKQAGVPFNCFRNDEKWVIEFFGNVAQLGYRIPEGQKNPVPDNGGFEGLVRLSRFLGKPVDRPEVWRSFPPAGTKFTLDEVASAASKVSLDLQHKTIGLDELAKTKTPALLALKEDGRIVFLSGIDEDRAVIVAKGTTHIVERSILEERYSGEALVPTPFLTQSAGIVADDAVREVQLKSLGDEVAQSVTLRNTGQTPVTLQLEYPLVGATEAKLSKATLAPGETATLDLKLKWRPILKTPSQYVLVTLQTNDPLVPRLQLASLLKAPVAPQ